MRMKAAHLWQTICTRLDRLQEATKKVNSYADETTRIVQGVERYLREVIHAGVSTSIIIDQEGEYSDGYVKQKCLVYDRFGDKFRIFVEEEAIIGGEPDNIKKTLWANCPRDVKLLAFDALPALIDKMIESTEGTLEQIKKNAETIESLFPQTKEAKS